MRCPKCGVSLGSHQVHPTEQCEAQQEKNRINMGVRCGWCNGLEEHKDNCPQKTRRRGG